MVASFACAFCRCFQTQSEYSRGRCPPGAPDGGQMGTVGTTERSGMADGEHVIDTQVAPTQDGARSSPARDSKAVTTLADAPAPGIMSAEALATSAQRSADAKPHGFRDLLALDDFERHARRHLLRMVFQYVAEAVENSPASPACPAGGTPSATTCAAAWTMRTASGAGCCISRRGSCPQTSDGIAAGRPISPTSFGRRSWPARRASVWRWSRSIRWTSRDQTIIATRLLKRQHPRQAAKNNG